MSPDSIFWFRRDLRLKDNHGLYRALLNHQSVQPIFIFDTNILNLLPTNDLRVTFIYKRIQELKLELNQYKSDLWVFCGKPSEIFSSLVQNFPKLQSVYTNKDYEPYAIDRDAKIFQLLEKKDIAFHTFNDHAIIEPGRVLKEDGKPYTVFTPFSKKWKQMLSAADYEEKPCLSFSHNFNQVETISKLIPIEEMGFQLQAFQFPNSEIKQKTIVDYANNRDFPFLEFGTSKLSVHFRFGTISLREKLRKAMGLSPTWMNELIWRDFYIHILHFFPHVAIQSFKPEYDCIQWRNDEKEFEAWCKGKTGYPIVDAGMRELNQTGFMHNRVRMIVASFLTKHLLIDWRWGEKYFAEKLLDFELASNNGGWQWAAGSGVDAAPYFRIFNPYLQTQKFDPQQKYIQKWVPEVNSLNYPAPIVQHEFARKRCLETYKIALKK